MEFAAGIRPDHVVWSAGLTPNGHPRCASTDRYLATLLPEVEHPFRCVETLAGRVPGRTTTTSAEWVTEASGLIVARSDGARFVIRPEP